MAKFIPAWWRVIKKVTDYVRLNFFDEKTGVTHPYYHLKLQKPTDSRVYKSIIGSLQHDARIRHWGSLHDIPDYKTAMKEYTQLISEYKDWKKEWKEETGIKPTVDES